MARKFNFDKSTNLPEHTFSCSLVPILLLVLAVVQLVLLQIRLVPSAGNHLLHSIHRRHNRIASRSNHSHLLQLRQNRLLLLLFIHGVCPRRAQIRRRQLLLLLDLLLSLRLRLQVLLGKHVDLVLPEAVQHLKVRKQVRRVGLTGVQMPIEGRPQTLQQIRKRLLLLPNPGPVVVLNLVRRDVHVHVDPQPAQRLQQTPRRDPGVLAPSVTPVQPVHVLYPGHQPHHGAVVRRERFVVVKLVDELIQDDATLAEAHQGQVRLVQVETFAPPEQLVDVGGGVGGGGGRWGGCAGVVGAIVGGDGVAVGLK